MSGNYEDQSQGAIKKTQEEIHKTVELMKNNIQSAQRNKETLDSLGNQADEFVRSTGEFHSNARDARRHFWWQNMKMKMCLIVAVIILIIVIVVPIAVHFK